MIELQGLSVNFGGRRVAGPLSHAFSKGSLVVILGPNGAGKTSLLRAVAGLVPFNGDILIEGCALHSISRADRARLIAYLPQGHAAHWPLLVREIVALGRLPHGLNDPARPAPADDRIIAGVLERMDVAHLAERRIHELSGGERARVMLARVLAVQAPVLLADEPTAALDPRHQIGVMEALKAEACRGALVVAVTHDLALASRYADEILLLSDGAIAARGRPDSALSPEVLRSVYGIEALRGAQDGQRWILPWVATP